jgi:casein kinase II subunit beta
MRWELRKEGRTEKGGKTKKEGANLQVEKYDQGHFGACPRVFCHATHVLPCGRADIPGLDTIKLYCPNCGDIYSPPSSKYASVDGESLL